MPCMEQTTTMQSSGSEETMSPTAESMARCVFSNRSLARAAVFASERG
jgi:hypothetical protein